MTLRENLGFGFMRDDAHVYCHDEPLRDRDGNLIEGIVIDGFRPLSQYLATDGVRAYARTFTWLRFTVLDVDAATFRRLDESHAVDANHVYFQNRKLAGASPARFRLLNDAWGHDDRYLYHYGKRKRGADPATLRWVGAYLVDAHRVWYGGRELEGADAASFVTERRRLIVGAPASPGCRNNHQTDTGKKNDRSPHAAAGRPRSQ